MGFKGKLMRTGPKLAMGCGGALAALSLVSAGAAACETPSMVDVPDGETATTEEMLQARDQVSEYVAAMDEYLACVNEELEAAGGDDTPDEYRALMIQRHNSAVSEMEAVAGAFNEQLRAFREANADE